MSWSYCTPVNSTAVNADKNPIGDGGPSRIFTAAVKAHFVGPSWSEPLENLRDIGFWRARHLDRYSQSLIMFPLICDLLLHSLKLPPLHVFTKLLTALSVQTKKYSNTRHYKSGGFGLDNTHLLSVITTLQLHISEYWQRRDTNIDMIWCDAQARENNKH